MNDRVQKALDERKKKREEEKTSSDRVKAALEARKSRISSNMDSVKKDLNERYQSVINSYNNAIKEELPTWGADKTKVYEKQRENRLAISNLRDDIEAYSGFLDKDSASGMLGSLDEISTNYGNIYSAADFYSQYKTKSDFNSSVMNSDESKVADRKKAYSENLERLAELDKLIEDEKKKTSGVFSWLMTDSQKDKVYGTNLSELQAERDRIATGNTQYERGLKTNDDYYDLTLAEDWQEKSAKRDYVNPTKESLDNWDVIESHGRTAKYGNDGRVYYEDVYGNVWDEDYEKSNKPIIADKLGMFLNASEEEKENAYSYTVADETSWAAALKDGRDASWDQLEEDEIGIYYYLLNSEGQESAYKYLDSMKTELNRRETAKFTEKINNASILEQIALNAASIPFNIVGGAAGFIEDTANTIQGKDINPYSMAHSLSNTAQDTRSATAEDFNRLTNDFEFLGMTLGDAYQSIMSAADSATGVALGSGTYGVLMGMGAATSEARELYEKGASKGQIAWGGVLAGAAEMVFEKLSIDQFVKMGDSKTKLQIVKNLLKQGGVEASEEALTEIANTITDAIVMGTQSEWNQSIQYYLDQGMTESEATSHALMDVGKNVWKAGIGGFISGGLMGGVGSVASYVDHQGKVAEHGQSILDNKTAYENLKALAMEVSGATDTKNSKQIQRLSDKASSKTTALNVGRLSEAVEDTRTSTNLSDISSALVEKGMSKRKAKQYAGILSEMNEEYYAGNSSSFTLGTEEQWEKITGDKSAYSVLSEVVTDINSSVNKRNQQHDLGRKGFKVSEDGSVKLSNPKSLIDNKFEVSSEGETINTKTGDQVKISGISSIKDGKMVLKLDNGETVNAEDVSFASEDEALIYSAVLDMGVNAGTAEAIVKSFNPADGVSASQYALGVAEAYKYGKYSIPVGEMTKKGFSADLTEQQRNTAYQLGQIDARADAVRQQEAIDKLKEKAAERLTAKPNENASSKATVKKGRVRFEKDVVPRGKNQKRTVSLAKHLARAIGIDIVFYDAKTTTKKDAKDANGYFDEDTDTIYLDLQNSQDDAKTIMFTLSHELTHFIKKWSPDKFNTFANFLMSNYAKHGVDVSVLLSRKMTELGTEDADLAYEEMICDACETMLLDSNAVYKLMELRATDLELFEKIKLHIHKILNEIRNVYKSLGLTPTSDEAKALLEMKDVLEQIYSLFEEAAVDATQSYQAVGTLETESVSVSEDGVIKMQMKQYRDTGRSTLLNYLKEQYGDADANNLISTIDNIYNAMADIKKDTALSVFGNWQDTEVELDENGHPIFTTSINNGDYKLNQDFSRVCKKRRQLDFVLNMLAEDPAFEASNLTKDDIVKINQAIKKHGFEIACALCFVDSKRFRQTEWADSFANTWNDILYSVVSDKSKLTPFNFATTKPNLADDGIEIDTSKSVMYRKWSDGKEDVKNRRSYDSFDSMLEKKANGKFVEGNANVRAIVKILKENPHLRHTFRGADIIGSQGFDTIQRLAPNIRGILDGWGGTSVPKPSSNDAIYDNSVLNIAGYNAKSAFAIGGVRMNSFSDFMAHMFFDYVQAFADLSAKGLPMHSYTKELDFARLFGLAKGKINMSAIAAIRENATDLSQIKKKTDKDKATEWEKSIAGLDISKLADKLGKAETDITYDDIIQNLDDCEYVWADESIDVRSATLLQSGIMYDNLSEGKAAYCYELIKEGKFEEAFKVAGEKNVNRDYAKHLGIITVGVSKAHILKLLRDPTIRMVIPYHKSGLNAQVAAALKIAFYEDFTDVQNTMLLKKDGSTVGLSKDGAKIGDKNIGDFNFYKYFGNTIDGVFYDGKATASKYLDWCENGEYNESVGEYGYYLTDGSFITKAELDAKGLSILPKFNEFATEENYYKLVEDFDCYDTITGEHSPQEAVDLFHDGLPTDYKDVLKKALKAEQKVSDDFRDHLDNHGLRDEVMEIVKPRGYKPSIKKQAKPSKKNPEQLDPRTVTREDVEELLNNVNLGAYDDNTYIPLRINTPSVLIYWAKKKLNDVIDDNPIAMSAGKAYQAMAQRRLGDESRPHKLSVNDMIAIIETMNDPQYIVYQGANGRYVEVINYNSEDGKKAFAVLEIGEDKDSPYMNGYEGGMYNILVTTFSPDAGKLRELLKNPKNKVIFDKEKDLSQRTSSSMVPSVLNDKPFYEDIIPQEKKTVKKQLKKSSYAPTFYSQMGKVVEGVKQEKLAANSVVNMLRGKGVKAEEIRWSGIVPFLEGKKSVTKQELLDFINSSMLQIGEQMIGGMRLVANDDNTVQTLYDAEGNIVDTYSWRSSEDEDDAGYVSDTYGIVYLDADEIKEYVIEDQYGQSSPKWSQYKLDGGSNYREIVFTMPNSTYSNQMMRMHWGADAEGVLVHARVQDFDVNGEKMLFIEELQSDYHNEGHQTGYQTSDTDAKIDELKGITEEKFFALEDYSTELTGNAGEWETVEKTEKGAKLLREYREAQDAYDNAMNEYVKKIPDAPFKENYHEFVLKRLLRMAAEQGYDLIGWTPAKIQEERWSDEFAEGYRIEYDQDMPKFLGKYGRQWGAKVGKTTIAKEDMDKRERILKETSLANAKRDLESAKRELARKHDSYERAVVQRSIVSLEKTIAALEQELSTSLSVWSMDVTDSMRESVLYEGQVLYQKKKTTNRTLLANALEGTVQNEIEKNKLAQYKEKIDLIESEQNKLSELRSQIKEISFSKGKRDTAKLKALQDEATRTANRINTYDRQLLSLEATTALKNVLNREKEMAMKRQKQKDAENLKAYKEKAAKTQRELLERYQESRKQAVEGRNKTAMRHKIKGVVSELNQLLLRGTKDKHVMIGLQKAVAEALDAVNMDTVGAEERVAKYNALIAQANDPDVIASLTASRDRIQEMGDKMNDKLTSLKNAYNDIKNSDDPLIANSYDEVISSRLEYIAEKVGNTPLRDMTLSQLEDVYDMYKMVLTVIRNSNKAFKNDKNESIATLGNRVMMEVDKLGKKKAYRLKGTEGIEKFRWNNLKPVYAFERIGSGTLTDIFNSVRAGEDTWAEDVTEAREYYLEQNKKYNYDSWDFDKRYKFTSTSGLDFELSLEQIMSLYAYSKREQAKDHLKKGGIVFDESTEVTIKNKLGIPLKFNPTEATAYNLSDETLGDIISKLSTEQRAFVDEMQNYLSTEMGDKGNEVSLEMYGVKLFKEKFYFPLKSATQYMAKAKEQQKGEVKIKNSGFSKETVQKANNPIVLTPFMDVWANHVNEMSMYHAFVLPMEDFYRVFNYKTPTSDTMATESVEMFIQNSYGKEAVDYIDQLLKDLNGGAVSDPRENFSKSLMSNFKKAAVMASASVVIQQPSSLVRAMALVDAKHFGIAPITRGVIRTVNAKKHKELWGEVKKYAPVAIIKEMGRFDTNMGRSVQDFVKSKKYKGREKVIGFVKDSGYRDDVISRLPALADEMAWVAIWEAVKRETVSKHKDLSPRSDKFLKIVGDRFTEVVTKTQVYDSVLARSANMRSKTAFMNMWTSFMAEPTTSINMLEDALIKARRGDKKYAAKAIGAVYGSIVLNAVLVSLVYASRDDDEDETFAEKYASRLSTEILDGINPITYIPFFKDAWSIAQGFDIERADMTLFTKLVDSLQETTKVLAKDTSSMSEDELKEHQKQVSEALWGIADNISSLAGIPAKNLRRDINGSINLIETLSKDIGGRKTTLGSLVDEVLEDVKSSTPIVGWLPGETKSGKLYDAIVSGDTSYVERLKSGYKDDKAYETAVRKALRENDSRIREAAQARIDGNIAEYARIAKEIKAEGFFSQDTIVASVNAEINALNKGETTSSDSSATENKESSIYKIEDYYKAIVGRDQASAYVVKEDIIKTEVANGEDQDEAEDSFNSKFASYVREQYEDGYLSENEAENMLVQYGEKSEEDAASKVQYWAFKKEYPDYDDLSEEAVDKYYQEVEPQGISIDTYYSYSKQRSKCKGVDANGDGKTDSGSVKAEVLRVINSLPLTYAQKDALYYLNGWSAKTIYEAPWR